MPEEKITLLQKADNSGNERQEPPLDQITLVREGQITAVRNTKTGPSRYRVAWDHLLSKATIKLTLSLPRLPQGDQQKCQILNH